MLIALDGKSELDFALMLTLKKGRGVLDREQTHEPR